MLSCQNVLATVSFTPPSRCGLIRVLLIGLTPSAALALHPSLQAGASHVPVAFSSEDIRTFCTANITVALRDVACDFAGLRLLVAAGNRFPRIHSSPCPAQVTAWRVDVCLPEGCWPVLLAIDESPILPAVSPPLSQQATADKIQRLELIRRCICHAFRIC